MINCIIQARMSSKRLPGKVLKKISNKPLLEHLIDRVKLSKKIKKIIVTTSASKSDQAIVNFCKLNKILYFRGNLRDVRKRYLDTIKEFPCKYFVRITGDSPLINPKIIDNFCKLIGENNFDLVTNVFPRSFPKGQTVEVLNTKVFQKYAPNFKAKRFKEHITEFFYKNGKKFSIKNIEYKKNLSHINMSVDNRKDLIKVAKILKRNIFLKKDLIKEYEEKY